MKKPPSDGDPEARRLARRSALLLSEAGSVARALEVLLKRADFDLAGCTDLIKALARQEQIALLQSHGRIEPRSRFKKHSSHALRDNRPTSMLYIDEGGKSNPERLNPPRPTFFSLTAIALPEEKTEQYRQAADAIKTEFFQTKDITFHEPNMRSRDGLYRFDGDVGKQQQFDNAIDRLVVETEFVAFGVGIRKEAFARDFVESGIDPYLPTDVYAVAILMLLERYVDWLAAQTIPRLGRVTFESQGSREDAQHQLEYARVLLDGSRWVPDSAFRNWLEPGLRFTPKQGSDPMELADMFARELFEWIRDDCTTTPKRWGMFSEKVYRRGDGMMGKFGVKVFPDSDIRGRVEDHRRRYIGAN